MCLFSLRKLFCDFMYSHARKPILRSVLATKTRQAPTENNIKRTKHIRARRNNSEGLPNDMREISAVIKCS